MSNPKHINRPGKPEPLTQEQIEQQAMRAFIQKREAVAHTVLAGISRHRIVFPRLAAKRAVKTADEFLKILYTGKPASKAEKEAAEA